MGGLACAGEVRAARGEHHARDKSDSHLRQENRELREMLIQNGLFIRVSQGLSKLGLEPPVDMREVTLAVAAEKHRASLVAQMPQVGTPPPSKTPTRRVWRVTASKAEPR